MLARPLSMAWITRKGFIRRELGSRLSNLRFAPDLHFQLDEGVAYSVRVSQLLKEVQQGEPNAGS